MILLNKKNYSIDAMDFRKIEFEVEFYLIKLHPNEENYFKCDFLVKIKRNGFVETFPYIDKLPCERTTIKDIRINYALFDVFYRVTQGFLPFEAYCPTAFLEEKDVKEAQELYADCKTVLEKAHRLFNDREIEIIYKYFSKNRYNGTDI